MQRNGFQSKNGEEVMLKRLSLFFSAFLFLVLSLQAGGWNNTLMGCRAMAMGGAFSGLANDPSAVFYNPAGLVYQEKDLNLSIEGFHIWPEHTYVMPTGTTAHSRYDSSLPQVFLSYRMSPQFTLGFGAYIPYAGGGVNWKEEQLGHPFKSAMGILTLAPTLSYKASEKLSLGFKVNYYMANLTVDTQMDPYGPMHEEESGTAISAGFGLMYRPTERLGVGLSIRGPARVELRGETSITGYDPRFGSYQFDLHSQTTFNLPWDIEVGLSYRLSERVVLTSSAQYTMWSVLDKVKKTIQDVPGMGDIHQDEVMDFQDILVVRGGMEYHIPDGLSLRAGIGYDRYATPQSTLSVRHIDVNKLSLLGGIGYQYKSMEVNFTYIYAQGQEREKEIPGFPMSEKYNLNAMVMGVGIVFGF